MHIRIDCPQCGGDIVFDEEIEVVQCSYCGSTNQITGKSGLPRFMLPLRWTAEECRQKLCTVLVGKKSMRFEVKGLYLAYAPYWRAKGTVFHWLLGKKHTVSKAGTRSWDDAKELKTKLFDFSFPAYREPDLGLKTLGVRTAAVPLNLFHSSRLCGDEIVLPAEVDLQQAIDYSNGFLTFGFSDRSFKIEFADTQLVGEVYSLVYFPFWIVQVGAKSRTGLLIIDGVANRIKKSIWDQDVPSYLQPQRYSESPAQFGDLHLIPFVCPVCGWDLPYAPDSKTHICATCTRAWAEHDGSYKEVDYQMIAEPDRFDHAISYMPFWNLQMQIHTPEGMLRTRADLRRLIPSLPADSSAEKGSNVIHFLIPAFRIRNVKSLSKLATLFCISPPPQRFRAKEELGKEKFESVCLAGEEAKELARVTLISMIPRYHRRARKMLKDAKLKAGPPSLVYYPFFRKGIYLREANSNHAIQYATVVLSQQP
jgi:hypothetical protein